MPAYRDYSKNKKRRRPSSQHIQLNKEISSSSSLAVVASLVNRNVGRMNIVNCITTLQRSAKLLMKSGNDVADGANVEGNSEDCGGGGGGPDELKRYGSQIHSVEERARELLSTDEEEACRARQVANGIWAIARICRLGHTLPEGLFSSLIRVGMKRMFEFKQQEVSSLLWAFGHMSGFIKNEQRKMVADALGCLDSTLSQAFVSRTTPQGISNTLWAFGRLSADAGFRLPHKMLSIFLSDALVKTEKNQFNAQELSNTIWACAKLSSVSLLSSASPSSPSRLGEGGKPILRAKLEELSSSVLSILKGEIRTQLTKQNLCNSVWSLAKLREAKLLQKLDFSLVGSPLDKEVVKSLCDLNAREATMIAWAYAQDEDGRERVSDIIATFHDSEGLSATQSVMLLWCCAKAQLESTLQIRQAIITIMRNLSAKKMDVQQFSALDVSNLMWALARLDAGMKEIKGNVMDHKSEEGIQSDSKEDKSRTCSTLYCDAKHILVPEAASRASEHIGDSVRSEPNLSSGIGQQMCGQTDVKHIANYVWALAKLGIRHHALEDKAEIIAGLRHEELNARDLANIAWGLAMLKGTSASRKTMENLAKTATFKFHDLNAQELSKFLWAMHKTRVVDKDLEDKASGITKLSFDFPWLSPKSTKVSLDSIPGGGRKLQNTGTAMWDASFVLAELLSRVKSPSNSPIKRWLPKPRNKHKGWDSWNGKIAVELGAGLGLPSIIASKVGLNKIVSTDGDPHVIKLLRTNIENNCVGTVPRVVKLFWDPESTKSWTLDRLCLDRPVDLVLASGVVYGADTRVFDALANTVSNICDDHTVVLLAHGQGAAPGLHRSTGPFFQSIEKRGFVYHRLDSLHLHADFRSRGCVVHVLKRESCTRKGEKSRSKMKSGRKNEPTSKTKKAKKKKKRKGKKQLEETSTPSKSKKNEKKKRKRKKIEDSIEDSIKNEMKTEVESKSKKTKTDNDTKVTENIKKKKKLKKRFKKLKKERSRHRASSTSSGNCSETSKSQKDRS